MDQILSLAFRPQTLSELVGYEYLAKLIRGHALARMPQAWMFSGDSGVGKTTIARILAVALQCKHGEFGDPCAKCLARKNEFDIQEINASEINGVEGIGAVAKTSMYSPRPPSLARVFILDEAQRISDAAQNLLLKHFEDAPKTTTWIICTTNPTKILRTLKNRCVYYRLAGLNVDAVPVLVKKALKKVESKLDTEEIIDALLENGIFSPRLILMALEKFLAGASVEVAVQVEMESPVNTLKLCRALMQGDWLKLHKHLKGLSNEDCNRLVYVICGYLKPILLQPRQTSSATLAATAIKELVSVGYLDETLRSAAIIATLYQLTINFREGK